MISAGQHHQAGAATVAARLNDAAESIAAYLLPQGKRAGQEWKAGSVAGEEGQSLSVRVAGTKRGVWKDFASGEGGDMLDLWAACRGMTMAEAIQDAKAYLGMREHAPQPQRVQKTWKRPGRLRCAPAKAGVAEWLEGRGIAPGTIAAFQVGEQVRGGKTYAVFPYLRDGELVNAKYRNVAAKHDMLQEGGAEPCLFGWHLIDPKARSVVIAEGEIDAMTLHQAGVPALSVNAGAGNHQWIENDWDRLERFGDIVVCFDDDEKGQKGAFEVVQRLGVTRCRVAKLGAKDANQWLQDGATDEDFRNAIADAQPARAAAGVAGEDRPPFRLLSVADIHALPPALDRVHGIYPVQGVGAIYGPSGSGKSFLVIDLMAAVAGSASWFGHKVRPGRVVYVMLEGAAGLAKRIRAWETVNERTFPDGVSFLVESFRLLERDHLLSLASAIDAIGGADVVVIDTLNRAAPGADENSPDDAGRMLEALQQLQSLIGGLVLVVHHTGKDATKGMRGHSSLFAAMDGAIVTTRSGDAREWAIDKAKDGRDGEAHAYRLRAVEVGRDEDDDPITSCAVVLPGEGDAVLEFNRPRPPKGGNQRIVYDALGPLFKEAHTFGKAGAPPVRPCIEIEAAVLKVRDRLTVEPKRRTERARQAITGLVASGVLGSNEGWIWLI